MPSFNCEKSISVIYESGLLAYFTFTLSWTLILYKDYVDKFVLEYSIYNKNTQMISESVEDKNSSTHLADVRIDA